MNPLVSVIVPVYNQERYLAESIDSILAQTFQDFELILVDDGSKDKSAEIIKEYAGKSQKIIPVFQNNMGKPGTLSKGAEMARGKYIAFMDHDDVMMPDRLEKQIAALTGNPEINAISCQCYYMDDKGAIEGIQQLATIQTVAECKAIVARREVYNCAFTGLMIEKKSFIESGGLDAQFWPCDDMEFFNRYMDKGYILLVAEDVLMKYRVHAAATSASKQKEMFSVRHYTYFAIKRRRENKPFISYKEYLVLHAQEPWWKRLTTFRGDYALLYHRTAGRALSSKKYGKFIINFSAATLLWPKFIVATLFNKIKGKLSG